MNIILTDDGTLDTVLRCTECGEEFRFNYEPSIYNEPNHGTIDYDDFVAESIAEVEQKHECPKAAEPKPFRW